MRDRPECPESVRENEIEITPAMIAAGLAAWRESAGDEFPRHSITNELTLEDIYRAMALSCRTGA